MGVGVAQGQELMGDAEEKELAIRTAMVLKHGHPYAVGKRLEHGCNVCRNSAIQYGIKGSFLWKCPTNPEPHENTVCEDYHPALYFFDGAV